MWRFIVQVLFTCLLLGGRAIGQSPAKVDYARDIQPIFRDNCIECHGPSQQMRGLRLDRRRDALPNRVGANGARIVPGNSAKSLLYQRVTGRESGAQMPPSGPLHSEQISLIKTWIDQGADWPDALSGDKSNVPPDPAAVRIMTALRNGDRRAFEAALAQKDAANARGYAGWTPLMYASFYGDVNSVRSLLEKGADANARNDAGATALMYAAASEEKTRLLLDHHADPNVRSGEGRTALLIAVARPDSYLAVKLLLERGADIKPQLPDGRGVLTLAIGSRDPQLLQLLLDRGAQQRPLPLSASLVNCLSCFDLLLKIAEPADLGAALQGAIRSDLTRLNLLLEKGVRANPNSLLLVAQSPVAIPETTIRTLIDRGADVNAKTPAGVSVLDFAKRHGNRTLIKVLNEIGSRDVGMEPVPLKPKPAASARIAIERVLPMLQRADVAFLDRAGCVSCHNNSLTAMTVAAARSKGIQVNETVAKNQLRRIAAFLEENAERALENEGVPGGIDTTSYTLLGLAAENYPSDAITDAWASYVKQTQAPDGRWKCGAIRPPLESSDFEVTAASIRSLRAYGLKSHKADYDTAVERAVRWLENAKPTSTEDHAFKILGLIWAGSKSAAIRTTATALLALQNPDGGWAQLSTLPSDAYATGQAIVALREADALATTSPSYRSGIQYLLNTQLEDGSWYVRTRAIPIQPQFDSDFPHGLDQFISTAASNWAAMALATSLR